VGAPLMGVAVLTLVKDREPHLHQLIEGLRRSIRQPDQLIIVDMSDKPLTIGSTAFPVLVDRFQTRELPLAAARNRAAALARHERLLFLDVDCIPMSGCIGRMSEALDETDGLLCADVRYLGPTDARADWTEAELLEHGRPHLVRTFPDTGLREEPDAGLFWSLAFAMRRERFIEIGGFDERFEGYGGEDTDFGFRASAQGLALFFVGGAIACHQHHESHEPPVQHVRSIVRNASHFRARWGRWPMEGWLRKLDAMGLVTWTDDTLTLRRTPTPDELAATRVV
jgi:GT2 family glycosyltransferase